MDEHRDTTPPVIGLVLVLVIAGCTAGTAPTPSSSRAASLPVASAEPSVTATTTSPTAESSTASATLVGGHVIHVNVAVPLVTAADLGSSCDAAALRTTGPIVATIPGSTLRFFDFDRAREVGFENVAPLGEHEVPSAGTVVKPLSDDPDFTAACQFSFDMPTIADAGRAYMFSLGTVYFPLPAILRADLEARGWEAYIGVNPQ